MSDLLGEGRCTAAEVIELAGRDPDPNPNRIKQERFGGVLVLPFTAIELDAQDIGCTKKFGGVAYCRLGAPVPRSDDRYEGESREDRDSLIELITNQL